MLADDFGWNNIGYRNPEIRSPTLDALATDGIKLDRHYTYKYCSPTRSALMSGRLPYHVNQNNLCNDEQAPSGMGDHVLLSDVGAGRAPAQRQHDVVVDDQRDAGMAAEIVATVEVVPAAVRRAPLHEVDTCHQRRV